MPRKPNKQVQISIRLPVEIYVDEDRLYIVARGDNDNPGTLNVVDMLDGLAQELARRGVRHEAFQRKVGAGHRVDTIYLKLPKPIEVPAPSNDDTPTAP